ncbi:MAG: hypothetical protein Q8R28_08080 [Dehalococcoidia bacterium]|nr:hypothetical protein [Dehalococcoidia bacterium]
MPPLLGCLYHKTVHEPPVHCAACAEELKDRRRKYCPPPKPCQETYTTEHWSWGFIRARFLKDKVCDCPSQLGRHVHCMACGGLSTLHYSQEVLAIEVHHVMEVNGGPRLGQVNQPQNLLALCHACHQLAHHPPKTDIVYYGGRFYPAGAVPGHRPRPIPSSQEQLL